jgi:hypothetical protein
MREVVRLFFAVLAISMAASWAFAQGPNRGNPALGNRPPLSKAEKERIDFKEQERELRMLEIREGKSEDYDPERERRKLIIRNIKELNDESDALLSSSKITGEKGLKESAKHAEKIAKLSNRLRHSFAQKGNAGKVGPFPAPPCEDPSAQLNQLATTIDCVVEQVSNELAEDTQTLTVGYMDRVRKENRLEQTRNKLEMLERQALRAQVIAKGKHD